ncbi:MAG: polysaccharide deacetylase family protein [Planctomycetaceae bacterium]|nr:polysaccharide deacetylase family protein [Planctomycetaceae bacterium]
MGGAWANPALKPLDMETCVYCRRSGREYGVRAIMEILEDHGLPGVFFVDTAMDALFGRGLFQELCQEILSRGHDVQMHLHPGARQYALLRSRGATRRPASMTDRLPRYEANEQTQMIIEGCDVLKACTGRRPAAFRAGCFALGDSSAAALAQAGIQLDFSANLGCAGSASSHAVRINGPYRLGSVTEFPVTQIIGRSLPGCGYRPLEVNCVSGEEMESALEQLVAGGARVATVVLHSFGLLKNRVGRWEGVRPDRVVHRRLETLCRLLDRRRGDLNTERVCDCAASPGWVEYAASGPDVWPKTTWKDLALRQVGQVVSLI